MKDGFHISSKTVPSQPYNARTSKRSRHYPTYNMRHSTYSQIVVSFHMHIEFVHILLIHNEHYFTLSRPLSMSITNADHIANLCLSDWIIRLGIPIYCLTSYDPHFETKCSVLVCDYLDVKNIMEKLYIS